MPKIIENARDEIIAEAKRQLFENGYAKTTIRSVAGAIGIGMGTIYNYFSSKDMLISSFILEDWRECLTAMKILDTKNKKTFVREVQEHLQVFVEKYRFLFQDSDASKSFLNVFHERHVQLRGILADIVLPVCEDSSISDKRFLAEHIAESILFWTMEGIPYDKQEEVLQRMLS